MSENLRLAEPDERAADRLNARRDAIERLIDRANDLLPQDRALIRGVYDRGMTSSEFADALGSRPLRVRRRIQRLIDRISSPAFRYVIATRRHWPARRRAIAEAILLRGETQRATATKLGTSVHHIRQELERIRALLDEQHAHARHPQPSHRRCRWQG